MLALVFICSSCQKSDKVIEQPLVVKYLRGSTNEVFNLIRRNHHTLLVRHGTSGRKEETLVPDTYQSVMQSSGFVRALRDSHVTVTNAIIASDIANLFWIILHGELSDIYLVDSVMRQGSEWHVQFQYYESPPDNCYRWPNGYITKLYLDADDSVVNIEQTAIPPLQYNGW